jgi:hypothetical protein
VFGGEYKSTTAENRLKSGEPFEGFSSSDIYQLGKTEIFNRQPSQG